VIAAIKKESSGDKFSSIYIPIFCPLLVSRDLMRAAISRTIFASPANRRRIACKSQMTRLQELQQRGIKRLEAQQAGSVTSMPTEKR